MTATDEIRSFIAATKATVQAERERDAALALLAAVRGLCDGAQSEGQGFVPIESVRAAMGLTGATR